eukprot:4836648-Pyramimonas_sp.AAC.1
MRHREAAAEKKPSRRKSEGREARKKLEEHKAAATMPRAGSPDCSSRPMPARGYASGVGDRRAGSTESKRLLDFEEAARAENERLEGALEQVIQREGGHARICAEHK